MSDRKTKRFNIRDYETDRLVMVLEARDELQALARTEAVSRMLDTIRGCTWSLDLVDDDEQLDEVPLFTEKYFAVIEASNSTLH